MVSGVSLVNTYINGHAGNITLSGTTNQVNINTSGSTFTFSTPQDIATTSSPTFSNLTLSTSGRINDGPLYFRQSSDNDLISYQTTFGGVAGLDRDWET